MVAVACWRHLQRGAIEPAELAERTGLGAADLIDLLVHLAWSQPLATRIDRARRVRQEHADFFERFKPEAREVLQELLDKYADHGIGELDDLGVLQVPPLSSLGSPREIADRFGGNDALRQAVSALQDLLYVA
jgi:type I restriction enzyme R subunit